MKLADLIECTACEEVDAPSKRGTCRTCGSTAIRWIVGQKSYQPEPPQVEQMLCGIDREILREMGVEA